ncbi:uncharacterized protein LOC129748650 [Uranotaenia lowii]|uniref:uncharacterized protein LOC129748650 n=1 Tax=Uranotaenia lowii TaxID=190385 RepID=UPI00247AABAF|nr:uncharacterized protein LOC129748650 [Uranotaenia lowii]
MVSLCAVKSFLNKRSVIKHGGKIVYLKFPKNREQFRAWTIFFDHGEGWIPKSNQGICSGHFESNCFCSFQFGQNVLDSEMAGTFQKLCQVSANRNLCDLRQSLQLQWTISSTLDLILI